MVSAESLLIDEMEQLDETPFHAACSLDFKGAYGIAEHLKGFYRRQTKRFSVAAICAEINAFAVDPSWGYSAFAYDQYDGPEAISSCTVKGETTPYVLNGMSKVQRGFPKRYLSGAWPDVAPIAKTLVIVKFFKLMSEAAVRMKTVAVPFVVSAHDTDWFLELHPGTATET